MSKLFNPFNEIVEYANKFKVDNPSILKFSGKHFISNEFTKIQNAFNHIIESLNEKTDKFKN